VSEGWGGKEIKNEGELACEQGEEGVMKWESRRGEKGGKGKGSRGEEGERREESE
jgi:hypothetical protein